MQRSDQVIRRAITGFGVFYLVLLLGAVATVSFKYRDYYVAPALDPTLGEDAVLQVWHLNYEHRYREYRELVRGIGLSLAVYLPVWAAALGVWKNSIWKGLIALAGGGIVTVLALSILPWVYFPFDKYPVAALWVMGASPWIALSWILLTIFGLNLRQRRNRTPTLA